MKILRIFFGFCFFMFVLFTYWQFNDPDAWFWVSVYGAATVLVGMAAFGKYNIPLLLAEALFCFVGFVYKYPSSVSDWIKQELLQRDLSMKTYSMELARESFGELIVTVVMLIAVAAAFYQKRKAATPVNTKDKTKAVAQ
ncbi:transmembrane 220 family protein [Pontibacter liquoris]|uniref:transmembrane 220 family protein n=1 Tax=Pontibacter liquoris TaxID=2905677 RepID=UPI001FA6B958|nr:transmembrane 220 family protein [Pontibacter liquoris]